MSPASDPLGSMGTHVVQSLSDEASLLLTLFGVLWIVHGAYWWEILKTFDKIKFNFVTINFLNRVIS